MHACLCMPPPCGHLPTTVVRFFPNEALNVQVQSSQRLQKIAAHASQWAYGHNATCGASGLHLSVIGAQMGAHVMAGACRRMQTDRFHQAYRIECNACASMHHARLCFSTQKNEYCREAQSGHMPPKFAVPIWKKVVYTRACRPQEPCSHASIDIPPLACGMHACRT